MGLIAEVMRWLFSRQLTQGTEAARHSLSPHMSFVVLFDREKIINYSTFDERRWWPGIRGFSECVYPLERRFGGRSNPRKSRFSYGSHK